MSPGHSASHSPCWNMLVDQGLRIKEGFLQVSFEPTLKTGQRLARAGHPENRGNRKPASRGQRRAEDAWLQAQTAEWRSGVGRRPRAQEVAEAAGKHSQ